MVRALRRGRSGSRARRVAQVVEAGFLRGEVRDVGGVGPLALGDAHPLLHEADGEPQPLVDRPHPGGVAPGEVVVEGEDVRAAAGQGLEEDGGDRGERLALAGRHLRDLPLREGEAGQDLLVERALPEGAPGRLAGEGESLGNLRVGRAPRPRRGSGGSGPPREAGVVERRHGRLERADPGERLAVGRQVAFDRTAAETIEDRRRGSSGPVYARRERGGGGGGKGGGGGELGTLGKGGGIVAGAGKGLAPQVGFEPTTLRLTAGCSTAELLRIGPSATANWDSRERLSGGVKPGSAARGSLTAPVRAA